VVNVDEFKKITHELAKIDEAKVKAMADGERVILMIQDAPSELRRLADALEKIDVREIKALVAYGQPKRSASSRAPKQIDAKPSPKQLEGPKSQD
jgi:hypothetical protein